MRKILSLSMVKYSIVMIVVMLMMSEIPKCPKCGKIAIPIRDREDGHTYVVMYWCDGCDLEVD